MVLMVMKGMCLRSHGMHKKPDVMHLWMKLRLGLVRQGACKQQKGCCRYEWKEQAPGVQLQQ